MELCYMHEVVANGLLAAASLHAAASLPCIAQQLESETRVNGNLSSCAWQNRVTPGYGYVCFAQVNQFTINLARSRASASLG
jgi:hypothetical protein